MVRTYQELLVNFNGNMISAAFSSAGWSWRLATGSMAVKVWDTASGKKLFGEDPSLPGHGRETE